MKKFKITAANKQHFDSLIRDFRNNGFSLVTCGNRLAELESKTEFVIIEYYPKCPSGHQPRDGLPALMMADQQQKKG